MIIRKRPNYKRRAFWIVVVILAIAYAVIVGGWWIEGNRELGRPITDTSL